jgi:hypothetical protein
MSRTAAARATVRAALWQEIPKHNRGRLVYWLVKYLGEAFKAGRAFPDLGGLEDLATVTSVMCG